MTVYVVCWADCYDGLIYEGVFSSMEKANAYIEGQPIHTRDLYAILEETLDEPA